MIIDTDQLEENIENLGKLINGYKILISGSPSIGVSQEAIIEMNEGLARKTAQQRALQVIVDASSAAETLDAFTPDREEASQEVIDLLKMLSDEVSLVPSDFNAPKLLADGGTVIIGQ
jgi:hypothetical protein